MISWTNLLNPKITAPGLQRHSSDFRPEVVVWNLTSSCNLRCQHCYFEASRLQNSDELAYQEAKDFIEDLARFKVATLLFSGGEPLLRKDIFALAGFAKEKGIKVALSTNGTLITEKVAREIKDAGFFYAGISIDGMEETHDTFRRYKGAFKASLSGIRYCKNIGLKVGLRFTLTKDNAGDLGAVFGLVEKESILRLCIYHLVYSGRGNNLKEKDLSPQAKKEILELIWEKTCDFLRKGIKTEILTVDNHADGVWLYLKLNQYSPQRAKIVLEALRRQGGDSSGMSIACVDNKGNIYPNQFWRTHSLGNIRERKFSQVWHDKDIFFLSALRDRKKILKGRCQRCNYLNICNGNFRARAESVFGDPWQEDPACYLSIEEIREKWN